MAQLRKAFGDGQDIAGSERHRETEPGAGRRMCGNLIQRWHENAKEAGVIAFLDAHGADVRLATKVLRYWPDRTLEKLQENPYRLLFLAG